MPSAVRKVLEQMARASGRNLSGFIEEMIRAEAARQKIKIVIDDETDET
jgi:hypothetical protein